MGDVVAFPSGDVQEKGRDPLEGLTTEQLYGYFQVGGAVGTVVPALLTHLASLDLDVTEEDSAVSRKDGALMIESLKAMLCRHLGLDHPFHVLSDSLFNEGENGMLEVAPSVSCNFTVYNQDDT